MLVQHFSLLSRCFLLPTPSFLWVFSIFLSYVIQLRTDCHWLVENNYFRVIYYVTKISRILMKSNGFFTSIFWVLTVRSCFISSDSDQCYAQSDVYIIIVIFFFFYVLLSTYSRKNIVFWISFRNGDLDAVTCFEVSLIQKPHF